MRHLPWLVCLVILSAACTAGTGSDATPGSTPRSTVTAGDPDADSDQAEGDEGESEPAEGEEGEEEGDADADLPGADRGPQIPEDALLQQRLAASGALSLRSFSVAAAQA